MKKVLMCLLIMAPLLGGVLTARIDADVDSMLKENHHISDARTKEEKAIRVQEKRDHHAHEKALKKQKSDEKRIAKEQARQEQQELQDQKKYEKRHKAEVAAHHRNQKREHKKERLREKRQAKRQKHEQCKEERRFMRSKEGKQHRAEQRRIHRREQRRTDEENKEHKQLEREAKNMRRKERENARKERRDDHYTHMITQDRVMTDSRRQDVALAKKDRAEMIEKWRALRAIEVERDAASGMYAYLYKQPAWPISTQFVESKHLINVAFDYHYAVDCYDSTGASSKSNITKLAFGEQPITFENILLVKKLFDKNVVYEVNNNEVARVPGFNKTDRGIGFIGRSESYGARVELSRYILGRDFAIGLEVPIMYRRNHLKASIPAIVQRSDTPDGAGNLSSEDFEDAMAHLMLKKILLAKGMTEMGGSATGLSDIAFFANTQMTSIWFDKLVIGLRCQVPTGKKATQQKLWAPELGNGGFTELSLYSAIQMHYQRFLNPHVIGTIAFNMPAHVDRRVPRKVMLAVNNDLAAVIKVLDANAGSANDLFNAIQGAAPGSTDPIVVSIKAAVNSSSAKNVISNAAYNAAATSGTLSKTFPQLAFSDRAYQNGQGVDDFDSAINGFGDVASSLKMTKGAEIKIRVGNIIERLLSRRGFFDMFYDFRCKMKDRVSELDTEAYNLAVLRDHTQQLEHRIGCEYSYQQGSDVRWRLGMRYTFAGMNVPKTLELGGALNYTF